MKVGDERKLTLSNRILKGTIIDVSDDKLYCTILDRSIGATRVKFSDIVGESLLVEVGE